MKAVLLDVNFLIALAWPSHVHHSPAHAWFAANSRSGWATCPLTECGFARISSNPKFTRDAVAPLEAIAQLGTIVKMPGHHFWPDEYSLGELTVFKNYALGGHRQIADAYLLSLAVRRGGKLATFDKGIRSLVMPGSVESQSIILVPVT